MTSTTRPRTARTLALTAAAVGWAGAAVALAVAPGATHLGGDSYDTEFISSPVYLVAALIAVVLAGAAAWWSWRWAAGGLAVAVAGLSWGGAVTVDRYTTSGWGDGLEVLVHVVPVAAAVGGVAVTAVTAALGRRAA